MENLSVGVFSVVLTFGVFSIGILGAIWSMFVHYNKQSRKEWNELRKESDEKWTESRKESEMKWAESRREWNELFKVFIDVKSDVHVLKHAVFKKEC